MKEKGGEAVRIKMGAGRDTDTDVEKGTQKTEERARQISADEDTTCSSTASSSISNQGSKSSIGSIGSNLNLFTQAASSYFKATSSPVKHEENCQRIQESYCDRLRSFRLHENERVPEQLSWSTKGLQPPSEASNSKESSAASSSRSSSFYKVMEDEPESFLHERDRAKKPKRKITGLFPVILFIMNDMLNGSFIFLPCVMKYNGWLGGLALIWLMGLLSYYTGNLLYRTSRFIPGAVTLGDLSFYLTRSNAVMILAFLFTYLFILVSNAQTISMTTDAFQYAISGSFDYFYCEPLALLVVIAALLLFTQTRTLSSIFYINGIAVPSAMVFIFGGFIVAIVSYFTDKHGYVTYDKLVPDPNKMSSVGSPLSGLTLIANMYFFQMIILEFISEMKSPTHFPKANVIAVATCTAVYTGIACIVYGLSKINPAQYKTFSNGILLYYAPYEETVMARVMIGIFGLSLFGSCAVKSIIILRAMNLFIAPGYANKRTWQSRFIWMSMSIMLMLGQWGLSLVSSADIRIMVNAVSILGMVVCFMIPTLLFLAAQYKRKIKTRFLVVEHIWLYVLLVICAVSVIFFIVMQIRLDDALEHLREDGHIHSPTEVVRTCNKNYNSKR